MPIQNYECLFLLDPTKVAGGLDAAKTHLHTMLGKYQAEILASRPWEDRRLAYPVKGHKKGQYYLIFFTAESLKMEEMQHDFRLSELILRFMVQHIPAKWVTEMLEVAKDDHRQAYQAAREESPIDAETGIPMGDDLDGGGGRPRRGGRRMADVGEMKD